MQQWIHSIMMRKRLKYHQNILLQKTHASGLYFFFINSQLIFFETSYVHVTIFVPAISSQAMETA